MAGAKQKGAAPKVGRGKRPGESARRARWREVRGPAHRLKRILLHNGYHAAVAWATARSHMSTLLRVIKVSTSTHVARRGAQGHEKVRP